MRNLDDLYYRLDRAVDNGEITEQEAREEYQMLEEYTLSMVNYYYEEEEGYLFDCG